MQVKILLITFFLAHGLYAQVANGNFEGGTSGWNYQSQGGYTLIAPATFFASTEIQPPVSARSGQYIARLGGYSYEINAIGQAINLPNTSPLYLGFYVQTRSTVGTECAGLYVGAKVSVIVNNQEVFYTYLCKYNDVLQWTASYIDLSPIAGQTANVIFKAESANSMWSFLYIDDVFITNSITSVDDKAEPSQFALEQNYPNPFNPSTTITFSIPFQDFVTIKVYDNLGREISTVLSGELAAGTYSRIWDAEGLPSGIYYYRLQAGKYSETKKLMLMH